MLRIIASTLAATVVAAPLTLATSTSATAQVSSTPTLSSGSAVTMLAATTASRSANQEVLLKARFDNLGTGPMSSSEFNNQFGTSGNADSLLDDSSVVSRGAGKAYRLTLDAGSYKNYPAGNNGINAIVPLRKAVTNACISYAISFDGRFDWSLGGKLPGLGGVRPGISPGTPTGGGNPGDKGWSGRMMWLGPEAYSWAGPTNMAVSYMYGPRQSSTYGDNLRWNKAFQAGKWHRVKQCYTMNTPGKSNGTLVAKMDGRVVYRDTSYTYRTRDDVKINYLYWAIFRGGGDRNWAGDRTGHVHIDNVKITTRS